MGRIDLVQFRRDTQTNWENVNPVLAEGEAGINLDLKSGNIKIGDGVTAWNSLPYVTDRPYPEVGTVTLDKDNQIKSMTDSVDSPTVDMVISGASAEQVVINGDFADGTTGWGLSNIVLDEVVKKIGSKSAKITVSGQTGFVRQDIVGNEGDKVIVKFSYYVQSHTSGGLGLAIYDVNTFSNATSILFNSNPPLNKWITVTRIVTLRSGGIRILFGYPSSSTGVSNFDEIMTIPITGTPYENFTADQMNAVVGKYWEGLNSTN
jgi:hypothetical protein